MKIERNRHRAVVTIHGDHTQPEPEAVVVHFPGGELTINRARDGADPDYWVHVQVNRKDPNGGMMLGAHWDPETGEPAGHARFTRARCDFTDKNSRDVESEILTDPALYHLALRITPDKTP